MPLKRFKELIGRSVCLIVRWNEIYCVNDCPLCCEKVARMASNAAFHILLNCEASLSEKACLLEAPGFIELEEKKSPPLPFVPMLTTVEKN